MAKIDNFKYTIEEAFRNCFYVVPDYQREYVWTDKEVQKLLDDINEQIDNGNSHEYFIGMVLVSEAEQNNHFNVIDGQQRLTTLFLLLCALRHLFAGESQQQAIAGLISTSYTSKEGKVQASLKLDPRYENAGEVMKMIVDLNTDPQGVRTGIKASSINSFGSLENLVNAYSVIYRYLTENYPDQDKLARYWGYLATSVIFIQIKTDVSTALKIFETINERGVGLNSMDLLKNLLFTQVNPKEFTKLKDEWKKITKPLEESGEKALRFLRYFLMANYKIVNKRVDFVVREDEIYDWLNEKNNKKLCNYESKPFDFVRKIARNVELYIAFSEGRGNDGKSSVEMDNLKLLCGGAFSLHFVLLLAANGLPKFFFDHFVRQLESFLFYYIFTKTPTKDLERSFSIWADELREICETSNAKTQTQKLDRFITERFQRGMSDKDALLTDALKRYTLDSMQRYRTRYLLAKLTQHVDMAYKGLRIPGSLLEYTTLEIEHILPDNPEKKLRTTFEQTNPEVDYDDYKTRLGNLALLEKPINIVASNDFFDKKKKEYVKCKHYLTSSLAKLENVGKNSSITRINTKLKSFTDWNAKTIDTRQDMLIKLSREIWKTSSVEPE